MQEQALEKVRTAGRRVSFWTASAAVFLVNALLSMSSSRWMLAVLQIMTAILAVLAAIEEWEARRVSRPTPGSPSPPR